MPAVKSARIRSVLWTLHRYIGIGLAVLLVPIAVSGALLVWHDHLDALIHPARYAVSGKEIAQPLTAYLRSAAGALGAGEQPVAVRFPASDGWPVIVTARTAASEGIRPRIINVYLDPPSASVLDAVDFRASLFGWLHRFHENLTIPEYSGRAIVGWAGVGMLLLSLTGIWLWWPRNGAFFAGLRWGRAAHTSTNLHHLLGFWISIPLAVVSLTGVYLGFPQNARLMMSSLAQMTPQGQRPGFGPVARDARLTPDSALAAVRALQPDARPAAVFLPTGGERIRARGEAAGANAQANAQANVQPGAATGEAPTWRVQLRRPDSNGVIAFTVNDRTGAATRLPDPLAGDLAAQWIRAIHEGSRGGPVWQVAVFLTGLLPAIFVVTGIIMWLRGRRSRRALVVREAKLQAAE